MIVVDASALAKYVLRERGWESVGEWLLREEPVTLDQAVKEVLNAVWKHATVLGSFGVDVARERAEALRELVEEGVVRVEGEGAYAWEAFRLALELGVTVYDALYIAQARRLGAPLLTADRRQAEAARRAGVTVYTV